MRRFYVAVLWMALGIPCMSPSLAARFPGATGALRITVLPVEADATVSILGTDVTRVTGRTTQREPDGTYLLKDVPQGQYTVVVESRRYVRASLAGVTVKTNETTDISISLELGAVISGTITPAQRVMVLASRTEGGWYQAFADAATGHYEVTGLRAGEYDLAFAARGGQAIRGLPPLPLDTMTDGSRKALAELIEQWAAAKSMGADPLDDLRVYSRSYRDAYLTYDKIARIDQEAAERRSQAKAAGLWPGPVAVRMSNEIVQAGGDDSKAIVLFRTTWEQVDRASSKVLYSTKFYRLASLQREAGDWKVVTSRGADVPGYSGATQVSHVFSHVIAGIRVSAGEESTSHDFTLPAEWK